MSCALRKSSISSRIDETAARCLVARVLVALSSRITVISLLHRRAHCRSGLAVGQSDGNLVLKDLGLGGPTPPHDRGEDGDQGKSGEGPWHGACPGRGVRVGG